MKDYTEAARAYLATCEWGGLEYGRDAGCDEGLGCRHLVIEHTDGNDDAYYLTFGTLDEVAGHLADLVADEWGVTEVVDLETGERVPWHVEITFGETKAPADRAAEEASARLDGEVEDRLSGGGLPAEGEP